MKESSSRAAVLAAVDEARLDLEAAAEREHRARLVTKRRSLPRWQRSG